VLSSAEYSISQITCMYTDCFSAAMSVPGYICNKNYFINLLYSIGFCFALLQLSITKSCLEINFCKKIMPAKIFL